MLELIFDFFDRQLLLYLWIIYVYFYNIRNQMFRNKNKMFLFYNILFGYKIIIYIINLELLNIENDKNVLISVIINCKYVI